MVTRATDPRRLPSCGRHDLTTARSRHAALGDRSAPRCEKVRRINMDWGFPQRAFPVLNIAGHPAAFRRCAPEGRGHRDSALRRRPARLGSLAARARRARAPAPRARDCSLGRRPIVASPVGLLSGIPGIGLDHARALMRPIRIDRRHRRRHGEAQSVPGLAPARSQALLHALNQPSWDPDGQHARLIALSNVSPRQRRCRSPDRALRRRDELPRRNLRRRLGPGGTAAPGRES